MQEGPSFSFPDEQTPVQRLRQRTHDDIGQPAGEPAHEDGHAGAVVRSGGERVLPLGDPLRLLLIGVAVLQVLIVALLVWVGLSVNGSYQQSRCLDRAALATSTAGVDAGSSEIRSAERQCLGL